MNILFLMGAYPNFGGVEVVSTILANKFVDRGCGVSLVSFEQPQLDKDPLKLYSKVKFYPLSKPTYSKENIRKLHEILVDNDVDVLINQWVVPYFVARLCNKAMCGTKCKMVGVHHNLPNFNHRIEQVKIAIRDHIGNYYVNRLKLELVTLVSRLSLKYTISKCDKFLVLSPSFVPIAEQYTWSKRKEKIRALANPLTLIPYNGEVLNKKKEIIYVGRIEYNQKCTYRIVDIWDKLENKYPDWCMKIVGDGIDRDDLQNRIDQKKLKNITIEGFQNPLSYYKDAQLLLLTSAYEGFGLVLVEGMEYGVVPIVYDSYAAVHDIIDNDKNGYIIPQPYSDDSFVEKIEEVINNENKYNELSRDAMIKAKKYSLENIVNQWLDLFREMTGKVC